MCDPATSGRPTLLVLLAVTAITNIAATTPKRGQYVPTPGYSCHVGRAFQDKIWITRQLDATGKQYDIHVDWWGQHDLWHPNVTAIWSARGDHALAIEDGAVFVQWSPKPEAKSQPPKGRSIELTTVVRSNTWPRPLLFSDEKTGPIITSSWSDIRSFTRGADRLFVILREGKQAKIFAQASLAPSLFIDGEAAITAAMKKMEEVSAEYRTRCEHVDDIVGGDIVVT